MFYRSRKIQAGLVAWKPNPDISMGFMRSSIRYVLTFQLTHTKREFYTSKLSHLPLKKKKLVVKTELFFFIHFFLIPSTGGKYSSKKNEVKPRGQLSKSRRPVQSYDSPIWVSEPRSWHLAVPLWLWSSAISSSVLHELTLRTNSCFLVLVNSYLLNWHPHDGFYVLVSPPHSLPRMSSLL